ncbi:MAG: hypothetical protein IPK97_16965 [Ahniella sp.]|nr:hypothetical protein [Ahniella sp.]
MSTSRVVHSAESVGTAASMSELPDVSWLSMPTGDCFVLAHTDGTSFSITGDQFRPLSPRLDNLALFTARSTTP